MPEVRVSEFVRCRRRRVAVRAERELGIASPRLAAVVVPPEIMVATRVGVAAAASRLPSCVPA